MSVETAAVNDVPTKRYQVGTLTYTKMGLASVFFWLLWGDFCFQLMETVMPALLPLTLKDSGASLTWIGIIVGTIPAILNATMCPIVSTWSDRHRGPRGRRIPFILWPSVFITLFLVLVAYSPDVGAWLHGALAAHLGVTTFSKVSVILIVVAVFVVAFQFFNTFVGSVYYYLWADVVPEAFLGRFMSMFRIVSQGATWVWSYSIFGLADTHMKWIYIGCGALYFVAFALMCLRVKEGEYPPPPPQTHGTGVRGMIKTYFAECFRHPFYVFFFVGTALTSVGGASRIFLIFLYRDTLQLSLDQIGKVTAWCTIVSVVLLYPAGYISDRLHPLRVTIASYVGVLITALLCFFFIHDRNSMLIFLLLSTVPATFLMAATLPMYVSLLPKERYGQFCSAQALLMWTCVIFGNTAAGAFIQWIGDYHYAFAWQAAWMGVALIPMVLVYLGWRRYGGAKRYAPPAVDAVVATPKLQAQPAGASTPIVGESREIE